MSFKCSICGRCPSSGKSISHSHRSSNRVFRPNLQRIRIIVGDSKKRAYVCTSCLSSNKVTKAV